MAKTEIQKEFQILREIYQQYVNPTILIGGDFNMNPDSLKNVIKSFIEEFNLEINWTEEPTRESNTLDYFLCSKGTKECPINKKRPKILYKIGNSDHL